MGLKIILHNPISIDCSYVKFDTDMGLHYQLVGRYKPGVYLVGSATASSGVERYHPIVPPETPDDFNNPERSQTLSCWVIPDSTGILEGMLHVYRRFEFCMEVIILVSKTTPVRYLNYLSDRNYAYIEHDK